MDKKLLLQTGLTAIANDAHYNRILEKGNPAVAYAEYGIHAFDFSHFSKYQKYKEYFEKIKLVEDKEFLKEVSRLFNERIVTDLTLVPYIIEKTPLNILPVCYRLFSQVSLLLDSHLHPNCVLNKNVILGGLKRGGCGILNNLNEIEICCFVVRYCDTKENKEIFNSALCPITIARVNDVFSSKKSGVAMCSCNDIINATEEREYPEIREIQGQDL
jgi:hypothetical protein